MDEHMAIGLEPVDSIDDLCLGIRKAYIKHLYNNDVNISNTLVDLLRLVRGKLTYRTLTCSPLFICISTQWWITSSV
jgi:hypothetical protein